MIASLRFIRPCMPITAKSVPASDGWLHDPKLDGYRLQVIKDGSQARLYSKKGYEWTKRLAPLAEAMQAIPCNSAALDAELCLPGSNSSPDFSNCLVPWPEAVRTIWSSTPSTCSPGRH